MNGLIPALISGGVLCLALHGAQTGAPVSGPWKLNDLGYFEAPAASILVFHNTYPEGKQGGLEIIQHGERVATNGNLRLEPADGQRSVRPRAGKPDPDTQQSLVRIPLSFEAQNLNAAVRVQPRGESVRISVDLEKPLPAELAGRVSFDLELYPPAFFSHTYRLGAVSNVFPRQANGPMTGSGRGGVRPAPLAKGQLLSIAPEEPLRKIEIRQTAGEMELIDGRNSAQNGWFLLRSVLPSDVSAGALEWDISIHRIPDWVRPPVIAVSQVGYHPEQEKRAVIEWDRASAKKGNATLLRINADGSTETVLNAPPEPWKGKFLRYDYGIFDFSRVNAPGIYLVRYDGQTAGPFRIARDIYQRDVWQPTLETYLPAQMCHVEVREGSRVWHGACHLDDALQAPASKEHFDGYRQGPKILDGYKDLQHIPGLNYGGWHDAGDYDLAAGSQAGTTFTLALAREAFGVATDQTAVRKEQRQVLLHRSDGQPDIVQQVAFGVENLLTGYRAAGFSFTGIIENSSIQYGHLGDAATITDNRIYDPALGPYEVREDRSGKGDDRWAFTNRDTSLEYKVAMALAAASRVLKGYDDRLAAECLETARKTWDYEQTHPPLSGPGAYVPGRPDAQEIFATTELLMTTGEARYRERLVALLPVIRKQIAQVGWTVARAVSRIGNEEFKSGFEESIREHAAQVSAQLAENPFGVPWRPAIWGVGWNIQDFAIRQYYLMKAYPALFDRENVLRVLNFVLGCHPGSNVSFVSGVGARSLTAAYGTNRADWSYIPGAVASGTALIRPDFPEMKDDFPFLWQQAENVIGGAASYIFTVLAADQLLNH